VTTDCGQVAGSFPVPTTTLENLEAAAPQSLSTPHPLTPRLDIHRQSIPRKAIATSLRYSSLNTPAVSSARSTWNWKRGCYESV